MKLPQANLRDQIGERFTRQAKIPIYAVSFRKFKFDDLVKSHEFNYRWLSKKVHIQGVVDGTFYDAIKIEA